MSKATVFGRVVRRFRNPLATRLSAASVKVRRSGTSAIHPSLPVRRHPAAQAFIPAIASTTASGNRNYTSGALNNVGTWGGCWSSSPVSGSANASNMEFYSTYVRPEQSNNRANGFTVRCVQHLQAVFDPSTENSFSDPEWPWLRLWPARSADSAIH